MSDHIREHLPDGTERVRTGQTFCASANPPATEPWCTVDKHYSYETVGSATKTHITEIWEGFGDPRMW